MSEFFLDHDDEYECSKWVANFFEMDDEDDTKVAVDDDWSIINESSNDLSTHLSVTLSPILWEPSRTIAPTTTGSSQRHRLELQELFENPPPFPPASAAPHHQKQQVEAYPYSSSNEASSQHIRQCPTHSSNKAVQGSSSTHRQPDYYRLSHKSVDDYYWQQGNVTVTPEMALRSKRSSYTSSTSSSSRSIEDPKQLVHPHHAQKLVSASPSLHENNNNSLPFHHRATPDDCCPIQQDYRHPRTCPSDLSNDAYSTSHYFPTQPRFDHERRHQHIMTNENSSWHGQEYHHHRHHKYTNYYPYSSYSSPPTTRTEIITTTRNVSNSTFTLLPNCAEMKTKQKKNMHSSSTTAAPAVAATKKEQPSSTSPTKEDIVSPYSTAAAKYIDQRLHQLMILAAPQCCSKASSPPTHAMTPPLYVLAPTHPYICTPTGNDIVLGRGCGINSIEGNQQFRRLVHSQQPFYRRATRKEKPKIARCLVEFIRLGIGGRFLKKDLSSGLYLEVGDVKAEIKTGQALREGFSGLMEKHTLQRKRAHDAALVVGDDVDEGIYWEKTKKLL